MGGLSIWRVLLAALALAGTACANAGDEEVVSTTTTTMPEPSTTTTTLPPGLPPGDDTTVSRIIDGDTVEVAGGTRIRFIGIDTPETSGGCFAAEATAHTRGLIPPGMGVRLVYDVGRLDRFGRTLAYVYRLSDGLFVNLALARDGYAMQLTVPPNVAHAEEFRAAVAEARNAGRGLWAACLASTTTTRAPATTRAPTTTTGGSGCHPSYEGACVPTNVSDVDCAGGSGNGPAYTGTVRVVGPDVYDLDRDGDGVGCERS